MKLKKQKKGRYTRHTVCQSARRPQAGCITERIFLVLSAKYPSEQAAPEQIKRTPQHRHVYHLINHCRHTALALPDKNRSPTELTTELLNTLIGKLSLTPRKAAWPSGALQQSHSHNLDRSPLVSASRFSKILSAGQFHQRRASRRRMVASSKRIFTTLQGLPTATA